MSFSCHIGSHGKSSFHRSGSVLFFQHDVIVNPQNHCFVIPQERRYILDRDTRDLVAERCTIVVAENMGCESADGLFGDSIHFLYDSFPLPAVRGFRHHFAALHRKQKRSFHAKPHVAFK